MASKKGSQSRLFEVCSLSVHSLMLSPGVRKDQGAGSHRQEQEEQRNLVHANQPHVRSTLSTKGSTETFLRNDAS